MHFPLILKQIIVRTKIPWPAQSTEPALVLQISKYLPKMPKIFGTKRWKGKFDLWGALPTLPHPYIEPCPPPQHLFSPPRLLGYTKLGRHQRNNMRGLCSQLFVQSWWLVRPCLGEHMGNLCQIRQCWGNWRVRGLLRLWEVQYVADHQRFLLTCFINHGHIQGTPCCWHPPPLCQWLFRTSPFWRTSPAPIAKIAKRNVCEKFFEEFF